MWFHKRGGEGGGREMIIYNKSVFKQKSEFQIGWPNKTVETLFHPHPHSAHHAASNEPREKNHDKPKYWSKYLVLDKKHLTNNEIN